MIPVLEWVLRAQLLSSAVMAGVIWFVQVVHYPLFAAVGAEAFGAYEAAHQRRTTWMVAPAMLVEVLTSGWLAWAAEGAWRGWAWTGAGLVVLLWVSTFLVQVPLHERLGRGWDARVHRQLAASNWVRTAAWSARAVIAAEMLSRWHA